MTTNTAPLKYQPYYCEENIWHLCQHPQYQGGQVIFIASYGDYFPMLCQQGVKRPNYPVFWDYHVVLLKDGQIYDFNTTLPFSTPVRQYLEQSFIDESLLAHHQTPMFRVLPAADYVARFLSDRRHMKTAEGWSAPPPNWPMISQTLSNLERFTNMMDGDFGKVYSADQLLKNDDNLI